MMKDDPDQWYVIWTSNVNWRQNYVKAEQFQTKFGFKSAQTEALQGKANEFEHASDSDPNQNKKYVSNIAEKKIITNVKNEQKQKSKNIKLKAKKGKHALMESPQDEAEAK